MIKSRRLKIYPASKEQMESFISKQTNDVLKIAYSEMLDGCLKHPNEWEWYAIWMIELTDGTHIGELCFKGIDNLGSTELGYGILETYREKGYATEAVKAVVKWAVSQGIVNNIFAQTEDTNIASMRVLEKAGFVLSNKIGDEGPIYIYIK